MSLATSSSDRRKPRRRFFQFAAIGTAAGGLILFFALNSVTCGCVTKIDATKIFVTSTMKTPLATYKIDMGEFPSTSEGLIALLTPPPGKETGWKGPYLELTPPEKMPLDPWKHSYVYRYPGTHNKEGYDLFSPGEDGVAETADDIGNW